MSDWLRVRVGSTRLIHRVVVVVVVVVFTLNRSFYPTTSAAPPVSVLILHPREVQIMWSQTVRQRKTKAAK